MKILLNRVKLTENATLGDLSINGVFVCHTLEDVVRIDLGLPKIMKETAIPAGTFNVVIDFSNRFQRLMLHVLDVPQFTGIRIHKGNTDHDTEGCILLGTTISGDTIQGSTLAYNKVFPMIEKALKDKEKVTIEVVNKFLEA